MAHPKIKRALISVYDKTGIVEFARALVDEFGIEIISTGGTAKHLKENGIPVTLVEDITGFPEMLDGRVKTLHPKIHAAILADRDNPEHMRQLAEQGIKPIDMVVVNLYPFEKTVADPNCTFEQAIEMIDIGGPCLLRAAAKNHKHVLILSDPSHYKRTLKFLVNDEVVKSYDWPNFLVTRGFQHTASNECGIYAYFGRRYWNTPFPPVSFLELVCTLPSTRNELRYGENPHQGGTVYSLESAKEECALTGAAYGTDYDVDHELELIEVSYNNYADSHAALELCKELRRITRRCGNDSHSEKFGNIAPTCVFIKHTNACGAALGDTPASAYRLAYLGDPNAAMGGILACSFDIDSEFALAVMDTYARWGKDAGASGFFLEVWVARAFSKDAGALIRTAKPWGQRVRLLSVGDMTIPPDPHELEYKSISGGVLAQTRDLFSLNEDQWKIVTKRVPTESEMSDLRLAWLIAKHTKSNAISICKDGMLIGNGAGQMSRVMSCRIATWLAKENRHEDKLKGSVAASDAFFPFPDGPTILIDAGVTAIIQPGGSKNDDKVIAACDERGVAMIFTGTRHFKH
ncbi:MAG: bifunctional phosphoribosylaminoimidazolecarboxamide formyltransferase/IMP cyclohydrolase [Planctomycetes bacterium]|nr:bifunctional phosphoribosylaminoimidazolecarboxamide formyltransferase/IMP cyclohydrolase [Planctomycetota bacterium]MBI3833496.1 bifunctional phosphoribosylaminoimidazolecarboxamide formyltransferase/IMP cyclohydrolase [Planctomycetota bacterium]